MRRESRFTTTYLRFIYLVIVVVLPCSVLAQPQKNVVAQQQKGAVIQSPQEAVTLDQILDQYGATGATRTDSKKLYQVLQENQRSNLGGHAKSEDIWEPKVFGKPCKEGMCQPMPTDWSSPTSSPGSGNPATPISPCGTKGACGPSVGGGGEGPKPGSGNPATPISPCGTKGACGPSVGGGGEGPKPVPINPCGASGACGPGVGRYGGVYDEKALQIMLHTDAVKLAQSPPSVQVSGKQ